ncbi:unnamed protein product [Rotaria socialis]|uniref:Uncharacterized protein n=1 Tax=Rotaria socialis TaxID=392032 RepID=A0A820TI91_9BILA|nr:unnamed protein product [Rotaria socialis]CAF3574381.1 unnamed protein product [Rotaria socialis]CAF3760413.1 unnamed protein product [Rotaria socialis]CAF4242909.1 unnamed protein product [Rotaria socialis]CAF4470759.1 unnamed protein product [Rotaria socialis]
MTYMNQHHSAISTVQLSPFGEDQWNRIVTYSPIYVHWTDMIMMTQQRRTHKPVPGKLNVIDPIDMNTLKLEDELLLNEIQDIRKAASDSSKGKQTNQESKVVNDIPDHRETLCAGDDYQASSNFSHELKEPSKHYCSYAEPLFTDQHCKNKRPILTNLTVPIPTNVDNQAKKTSQISLASKYQSSVLTQLRHSAATREQSFSSINDHRSMSPLSVLSSKRNATSAHSNHRYSHQQKYQPSKSSLSNEINTAINAPDPMPRESSAPPRTERARSTTSSRSTLHMLKTKNERKRQKQQVALKTLLVDPWKQMPWNDGISDETIPNSLDIMHKMCGPATPFERNLRYNYHRQLNQLRNSSAKS